MFGMVTEFLWDRVVFFFILFSSIYYTLSFRFVQFRYFGRMVRVLGDIFKRNRSGRPTSFQALMLSIGGHVGSGNIAGVAVAISVGGSGAVFWMWVAGLLSMSLSFLECVLAQLYKTVSDDGYFRGGPAFYMMRGIRSRYLACFYSFLMIVTLGFAFAMFQSNVIASSLEDAFSVPIWLSSVFLVCFIGFVIFGGFRRIIGIIDVIVPFMSVWYIGITLLVVVLRFDDVLGVLSDIVLSAFGFREVVGGGVGTAILHGVRRAMFSSEAGLGSAPNTAATAAVLHPVSQGITQAFSVFVDTIVICSCTALLILLSDVETGSLSDGIIMTQHALEDHIGSWGRPLLCVGLVLFALSSMIYNYYVGETGVIFFRIGSGFSLFVYRIFFLCIIFWGCYQSLRFVLTLADFSIAVLALLNLSCLVFLFRVGKRLLLDFDRQIASGILDPVFDSGDFPDLDLDHAAWVPVSVDSVGYDRDDKALC